MLTPRLLNRLRSLRLLLPGTVAQHEGSHSHRSRGRSMEFSEHRDYVPGDDVRHIDWNVYARLEHYVVKVFQSELEQPVYILYDASASMAWDKLTVASGLASGLAFVALVAGDRVGVTALGQHAQADGGPPMAMRGLSQWHRLAAYLEAHQEAAGQALLSSSLRNFALSQSRPGQIIVISDFLEPDSGFAGLSHLLYQKHRLTLIQLLAAQEMNPDLRGDLRLTDMEQPLHRELTVDNRILRHYRSCLQEHTARLQDWCRRHRCFYFRVEVPGQTAGVGEELLEELLTRDLCKAGLLR